MKEASSQNEYSASACSGVTKWKEGNNREEPLVSKDGTAQSRTAKPSCMCHAREPLGARRVQCICNQRWRGFFVWSFTLACRLRIAVTQCLLLVWARCAGASEVVAFDASSHPPTGCCTPVCPSVSRSSVRGFLVRCSGSPGWHPSPATWDLGTSLTTLTPASPPLTSRLGAGVVFWLGDVLPSRL